MRKREELQVKDTWKMEDLFSSDQVWEESYEQIQKNVEDYRNFQGRLSQSSSVLYECLTFDDLCNLKIESLFVYARQKSDENTKNPKYQDYSGRARSLAVKASALSSFILPEILEIEDEQLEQWLKNDTKLALYQRAIEMIKKRKQHTLSFAMEKLLADSTEATQGASEIFTMFNNADIKFPTIKDADGSQVEITHGNYVKFLESRDRDVRKAAFDGVYESYGQFRNTLAAIFSSNIKQAVFYAKARNYSSSREYYLSENEIPEEVYDNLVAAVREALPSLHRHMALRKRMLNLEELHMYDIYVPMAETKTEDYTFESARELVEEGLKPLGAEYGKALKEGFENRWIDVYENEGKRSGAYSWGAYGTHPYVLLNFNGTLNHVFTLAHEMGHALHSYYSDQSQPYVYAGYKIFVAEVASTCNEALLIRHMLKSPVDKGEKAYLLNHFLESFRATVFRQTMFAEFEKMAHAKVEQGMELTAESLCEMYHKLNEDYYGPDVVVDSPVDMEWGRIPHFYTPFYVYQYSTGFAAAVAISSKILSGDETAATGYQAFLRGGCSMTPIELLRLCGIDMMKPEPVREALEVYRGLLDEFEQCFN